MLLSLCMIVRNERQHLERCLRSVQGVAEDIVVVDTGSTDGTREIALRAGARVFDFAWVDDFAAARNRAVEQARAPWILVLDADEQLLVREHDTLRNLLRQHTPAEGRPRVAFNLLVNNSKDGGRSGMLARIVRLFPNDPKIRYEWPIHEQVATSVLRLGVPIVDADVTILHDGYADPTRNAGKQRRNLAILEKQIAAGGACALTYFLAAGARLDLGDYAGAIPVYQECVRLAPVGDPFRNGSQVGIAICLHKLGRHVEVCAETAEVAESGLAHPEQLLVRGNSLKALGDLPGALGALRTVLGLKEAVYIPPCDLVSAKLEAVVAIAAVLKMQGDELAALKLMKGALERRTAGQPLDTAWLEMVLARNEPG